MMKYPPRAFFFTNDGSKWELDHEYARELLERPNDSAEYHQEIFEENFFGADWDEIMQHARLVEISDALKATLSHITELRYRPHDKDAPIIL